MVIPPSVTVSLVFDSTASPPEWTVVVGKEDSDPSHTRGILAAVGFVDAIIGALGILLSTWRGAREMNCGGGEMIRLGVPGVNDDETSLAYMTDERGYIRS